MNRVAAILPAAGLGTRMGVDKPKQFLELDGLPLVVFALRRLAACQEISEFLVATLADEEAALAERIAKEKLGRPVQVVRGGGTRQESVGKALAAVTDNVEIVLVHDAVRPLVTRETTERVLAAAREHGAAIAGIAALDTVKEVKRTSAPGDVALIRATIPRERVVLAQTPQAFRTKLLRDAYAMAWRDGFSASDEAGLVERLGHDVYVVAGSVRNLKVTRPGDMELARFYLEQERKPG
jgi:2-C-methyl-D-erythritol 4-phosphate cytidylyltransferase